MSSLVLGLVSVELPDSFVAHLKHLDAAARAIGHAGGALCHLSRGDVKQARPALKQMLSDLEQMGASAEELEYLRAFIDCGGDAREVTRGKAVLKQIEARTGKKPGDSEELDVLRAYCDASGETSNALAAKLVLTSKLLQVAMQHANQYGGDKVLGGSPAFQAVGALASVCAFAGRGTEALSSKISGAKDKAKGLLQKLR